MITDWLFANLLWIKAFHIVAIVCWFAALFYLPRLFVYHSMAEDAISKDRFVLMEQKLYKVIANPAMMASITLGILLLVAFPGYVKTGGWIHLKLLLVVLLVAYHILCKRHMKALAEGQNTKSNVYFRWFNEVPVVLLISIVILVVVKPF